MENKENKTWYAVQETEKDALDYGSYDYEEAFRMAQDIANEKGEALIAYIDEECNFCDDIEWVYKEEEDSFCCGEVYPL